MAAGWQARGNCRVWLDREVRTIDDPDDREQARRDLLAAHFFPRTRAHPKGRPLCANCPVAFECLLGALENRERFGLFGGASEEQRRVLLRRARMLATLEALETVAGEWIDRLDRAYVVTGRPEPAEMRHGTRDAFALGCRCPACHSAEVEANGRCVAKTGIHRKRSAVARCGHAAVNGRHLCPWHLKVSDALLELELAG